MVRCLQMVVSRKPLKVNPPKSSLLGFIAKFAGNLKHNTHFGMAVLYFRRSESQDVHGNSFVVHILYMETVRHNIFSSQRTLFSTNNLKPKS